MRSTNVTIHVRAILSTLLLWVITRSGRRSFTCKCYLPLTFTLLGCQPPTQGSESLTCTSPVLLLNVKGKTCDAADVRNSGTDAERKEERDVSWGALHLHIMCRHRLHGQFLIRLNRWIRHHNVAWGQLESHFLSNVCDCDQWTLKTL